MPESQTMPAQTAASPVSTGRLVLRYVAILVGGAILLNLVFWTLETYFNIQARNVGAMGLILIWVAASAIGNGWYRREGARPAAGRAWTVALACAAVTYILQGLLIGLIYAEGIGTLPRMSSRDQGVILGVLAGLAVLELLIIRLGIGMGAKQAYKYAMLRAERAAG